MVNKKKKPKFNVQNLGFMKSVKARWRKPRGTGNKKRKKQAWTGASPRIGYKNHPSVRGLHPLGLPEVLVANPGEVKGIVNKLIRIASAVGARKALEIERVAKAANLIVLNPRTVKPRAADAGKAGKDKGKKEAKAEAKMKVEPGPAPEPSGPTPPTPEIKGGKQ